MGVVGCMPFGRIASAFKNETLWANAQPHIKAQMCTQDGCAIALERFLSPNTDLHMSANKKHQHKMSFLSRGSNAALLLFPMSHNRLVNQRLVNQRLDNSRLGNSRLGNSKLSNLPIINLYESLRSCAFFSFRWRFLNDCIG
jgi:hypothetical protein